MAVGPLAGQGDEQVAGLDQPGVDGAAADRRGAASRRAVPPVTAAISAAVEDGPAGGGPAIGHAASVA